MTECRVYAYGSKAPVVGAESVRAQMSAAHEYRNRLCEIEHERRASVDAILRLLSPRLMDVDDEIGKRDEALTAARDGISAHRSRTRTRETPPGLKAQCVVLRDELRALRAERKVLRTALFADEQYKAKQVEIDAKTTVAAKALRAEYSTRLGWGTRGHIEASCKSFRSGAPPKIARWDGSGHLAVQFQHHAGSGGDPAPRFVDLVDGEGHSFCRLLRVYQAGGKPRAIVRMRIGTDAERKPVWCEVLATIHRMPPDDARVKWVHLIRNRIACSEEWSVQFVLARETWDRMDCATTGTVGIDVGWRMIDGRLRVAVWRGSDRRTGELFLPDGWLEQYRKTEDIRSIRDRNFNAARDAVVVSALPESLQERAKTLYQWRSPARLAALCLRWRSETESAGTMITPMLANLESWRKRDRHLYEYESHLRDQLQKQRLNLYRVFAADMRRHYRAARIEDLDLREFHVLPKPDDDQTHPKGSAIREHTRDAALSILRQALTQSMAEVVEVDAARTTMMCARCGHVEDFDRVPVDTTPCPKCGVAEDQDVRAAKNILRERPKKKAVVTT